MAGSTSGDRGRDRGKAALSLTLIAARANHTNAVKYGACRSGGAGRGAGRHREAEGGPNCASPGRSPAARECGTDPEGLRLAADRARLSTQVEGTTLVDYAPDGVRCVAEAPLANFEAAV